MSLALLNPSVPSCRCLLPLPSHSLDLQVIRLFRIEHFYQIGCLRFVPALVRIGCLQFFLDLLDLVAMPGHRAAGIGRQPRDWQRRNDIEHGHAEEGDVEGGNAEAFA